jgi:hypothetical protein
VAVSLELAMTDESTVIWPWLATGVRVDASALEAEGERGSYQQAIRDLIRNATDDDR